VAAGSGTASTTSSSETALGCVRQRDALEPRLQAGGVGIVHRALQRRDAGDIQPGAAQTVERGVRIFDPQGDDVQSGVAVELRLELVGHRRVDQRD
jgi:hypothetical protein